MPIARIHPMRATFPTLTLLFLILSTPVAGCNRSDDGATEGKQTLSGVAAGCNVLLITMDTTRADRLGCYGYAAARTPALDVLAGSGVRLDQAFAQAPITLPSHTTLMTGAYPPEHGVRDNFRHALGAELPTLAETFRRHGYQTGAFVAATVLNARYGLERGFESYDDDLGERHDLRGDIVADKALAWLERLDGQPFFCWVHFFDPHAPYAPPPEYLTETQDAYDGEIAFMDAQVGRLLGWLAANGLRRETLVVAVGDHGESLGEHGYSWHALLVYDGIMRVPLLFSLPGRLPAGATRVDLAGVVDVMPTVLELFGWPIPEEVSGVSLVGALAGSELPPRTIYGETDFPFEAFGWSPLRCLIDGRWKYIRAPRAELYDRGADPGETNNIADRHADVVVRLEQQLGALESRMRQRAGTPVRIDTATLRALRSLGYVGGPVSAGAAGAGRRNPIEMVGVVEGFRKAESLLQVGRTEEALALIEPAAQRSPESFVLVELLGKAYASAGMLRVAEDTLLDALAIQPESPDTWYLLARVRQALQALPRAADACSKVLDLEPDYQPARDLLAELGHDIEQQAAQIAGLREQCKANPDSMETRIALGQLLARAGRRREALEVFRAGLRADPGDELLNNELAWLLATAPEDNLRDGQEAVRCARVACRGDLASDASAVDTLAAALAEAGLFEEAVQAAQRAAALAAEAGGSSGLDRAIRRRLKLYETQRPYRTPL